MTPDPPDTARAAADPGRRSEVEAPIVLPIDDVIEFHLDSALFSGAGATLVRLRGRKRG